MTIKTELNRRSFLGTVAAGAAGAAVTLAGGPAFAQGTFPSRPIRWVCYQAAGGSMDLTMRACVPLLEKYGIKTQLDYVTGGSGNPARTQVFTNPDGGYAMVMEAAPAAVLGEVVAGAAYKALDFNPIMGWSVEGWQLCTAKDGPIRTVADLVKACKERTVTAASIGRGSTSHLQLLVMQEALGVNFNIVHFSGSAQAYPQAIGGNVDFAIGGPGSGSRARDRLHIFAVVREEGEAALPDVQTMAAQGFPCPAINQTWYTAAGPGVPEDRLKVLVDAFSKAFDDPDFAVEQEKAGFVALQKVMPDELQAIEQQAFELANKYKEQLAAG